MTVSPTSVSILETSPSLGKMVPPAYGERKTKLSTIVQTIYRGILGLGFFIVILEARQKRREKLSETPIKKKIR